MNDIVHINKRVSVVAIFSDGSTSGSVCYPAKMRYEGREITFSELGLRHPTAKGKRMIHVFDMSDGSADYRLEFDAESLTWTLVAVLEGNHEPRG